MKSVIRLMFALLADGTGLKQFNKGEIENLSESGRISETDAERLYKLSAAFDCSHLVGL